MERTPGMHEAGREGQTPRPETDSRAEEARKESERQNGGRDDAGDLGERETDPSN